jgi:hypothetical protein
LAAACRAPLIALHAREHGEPADCDQGIRGRGVILRRLFFPVKMQKKAGAGHNASRSSLCTARRASSEDRPFYHSFNQ